MFVVKGEKVPIKIYAREDMIESEALDQLKNLSSLPFVYRHVAVMPDCHAGKGSTVGTVVPTKKAIIPACVGVDIGCGMIAMKTPFKAAHLEGKLEVLRHSIERAIPVGHNGHKEPLPGVLSWAGWDDYLPKHGDTLAPSSRVSSQLGTLGGGNHFIEIQLDEDENVWAMLHSGSRNIGKTLAEKHIKMAQALMEKYFIKLLDKDLAYLSEGTDEFKAYWDDLQWAQSYALFNRDLMMGLVKRQIEYVINGKEPFAPEIIVNCHHNYTEQENHFGENVYVTRKGAIRARTGDLGIIPGSMGTGSYIVRGKGESDSFNSCSHGAGRRMSRSKARLSFTLEDIARQTSGVECRKDIGVVDEIPGAYKDINDVMECQTELVEVVAKLKQVLCIKG